MKQFYHEIDSTINCSIVDYGASTGLQNERGASKVLLLQKREGAQQVLAMLNLGATGFEVVLTQYT